MQPETADAVAAGAHKVSQFGAVTAAAGYFTINELVLISGAVIAALGFLVNWYYKHKADRREERIANARLKLIEDGKDEHDPT